MTDFVKAVLGAQPYALFMVAGLFFLGVGIVGSIKTYFDPGDKGRIAAGVVGVILLLTGVAMYRQQQTSEPPVSPVDTAKQELPAPHISAAQPVAVSKSSPIAGVWRGVIEIPGQPLEFVLHINGSTDALIATADSPDQNEVSLPVDSLTLDGQHVRFTMPFLDVKFEGTLDGNHIVGVFVQHGVSSRLVLTHD